MRIVPASLLAVLAATVLIANLGCGSRASNTVTTNPPPGADFSLTVSPATLSLMAGTTGQVVAVTANALNGFTASVNVTLSGLPTGVTANPSTLTLTPGTAQNVTLTAASTAAAGMATITLTGTSGGLNHTATAALTVTAAAPAPDFSLTVAPTSLALTAGAAGQAVAVSAKALNGFTGSVNVTLNGLPAGVTANPSTLTLIPGTAQNVTLTAGSTAAAGMATITLTGTSGSLNHMATVALRVTAATPAPDFSLTVAPTSLALTAGAAGQAVAVSAKALNGFTASVNVTLSGLPTGVTASPSTLTLIPGTAKNVTLTAASTAAAGMATITLTGTSGSLNHMAIVALTLTAAAPAPDFSLTVAPTSLALTAGAAGHAVVVNANALNGFTASVNVTLNGLPTGVTANPSTLTLTPGTAQNVTLTASSTAATGTPTVTFTGTSGDLIHSATLQLNVSVATAVGIDVTTYHYDNARDGLNANETTLTPGNVNSTSFGKVGFYGTDGRVDGAPLYLSGMTFNGQPHNVLYVVSEHDSVYAFDADSGVQLWKISVLGTNETTSDDHYCGQITPEIGITSTPVIDRSYGAHGGIFVVGMTKDASGNYHQRLHALDLTTGAELSGGPTEIQATYPGTGAFSSNGLQTFNPGSYAERVGLLLMNGTIYLGWTSHCDQRPYTGWLMAYSEQALKQTSVLNLTPNSGGTGFGEGAGSIWMSGAGLAADTSGNIYFLDANGGFDATLDANGFPVHGDYGNAFMKISTASGKLAVADYFNSSNTVMESDDDQDLGSGGVLLLPDLTDSKGQVHQLAVGAGKDSSIYIVDRNDMGKFHSVSNNIYQQLPGALANGEWGMPAWFNGTVYYGGQNDMLKAFSVVNAQLQPTPASQSSTVFSYPGTTPSVSANGTQNGIVWAVENSSGNGVLHACSAAEVGRELYNSNQAANGRDSFADNKFITPVVANGKVYVGTPTGVAVFGLLTH
jgi:phosphoheptose isomerase